MQRLYRESHANGTIESREKRAGLYQHAGTKTRRDDSRGKGRKKTRLSGAKDLVENALLIISPKGEELIPRKKPQPNYSSRSSPAQWTTLSTVSTLSVPLICNVNPRTEDLAPRVCILRRFSFSSREEEKESGMGIASTICFKYAV